MRSTILLTGITGFLGSHLAENLSKKYKVVGLVRSNSDLWRYEEIKNENIVLINWDDEKQYASLQELNAFALIHAAWGGVAAGNRDDDSVQAQNIVYTQKILNLAKELGIKRFISFGSQAEYGVFNGRIDEAHECKPVSAYGKSKFEALNAVKDCCNQSNIHWNWFRLFSLYGTRENLNWLLPSVIKNALEDKDMELTACEQRYDYLSVEDFSNAVIKVLENKPVNGVFNLSLNNSTQLKTLVQKIIDKTGTKANFKFGALPYRPNQVMHIEGNSERFFNTFHFKPKADLDSGLLKLIEYYRSKLSVKNV